MKEQLGWIKIAAWGFAIRVAGILLLSVFENVYSQSLVLTDIDYKVYSDASLYPSPYDRQTYRYSPVLSYLMSANYSVHESIGKILFALFDVVAIGFLYGILSRYNNPKFEKTSFHNASRAAKLYAYNPLFIYLTVRGSCESITLALMYAFWYYLFGGEASGNQSGLQLASKKVESTQPQQYKRYIAYLIYGLWVHFRVYPIILLPLILMNEYHLVRQNKLPHTLRIIVELGIIAGGVFIILGVVFYCLYGYKFIEQTYLYHLSRRDNRHSFSAFFYEIYLNYQQEESVSRSFIRIVPFGYILISLSVKYIRSYSPFYLHFLATLAFVTFNKVITMQYYMWIFGALLLVLPESLIFINKLYRKGLSLAIQYFFPIIIWIWMSMRLQGSGENNLHTMWMVCLFQVYMHLWVLINFMKTITRYNPRQQQRMKLEEAKSLLGGKKKQ